jgi:hypothetical protein
MRYLSRFFLYFCKQLRSKMAKRIQLLILFVFAGLMAVADDINFVMSAPGIVTMGEQFSLTFSLNERGEDLRMPEIENFDILMGPSVGSSRSMQIINGRTTQSVNYTYTFILRANKEGTFTIPPASIKVNRKVYPSNSISVQVIKGNQQPTANDQLFIKYETDKTNVFKGEQIQVTLKLYSRVGLSIVDQTLPSFEGFWTQDIELPQAEQTRDREAVDGVIFNVYTLQKKVVIPQQTGTLYIEPAEMVFDVQQRVRSQSVFDDFFGSVQNIRTQSKSKRIAINVKDLPPAPAGFNGAVGRFSLTSSIDKEQVLTNEAITIGVKVDGNGNLRHITPFKFSFPPDFEVYDPRTSYNTRPTDNGIIGSTSFEQVVIPRFAGTFSIPSQRFVYFDPSAREYKTLQTRQFDITVERGSDDQTTTMMSAVSKENLRFLGQDIRYINNSDTKLEKAGDLFFGSKLFYGSYLTAFIGFFVILFMQKKRARENANIALMRNRKASKMARKHLKAASVCVRNNNTDDFFEALMKAFWGYLSDKLSLPLSQLNRDNARATLSSYHVDDETINGFMELIDTCEMARFAPSAVTGSIGELFKGAEKLIGKFEKQIRKRK